MSNSLVYTQNTDLKLAEDIIKLIFHRRRLLANENSHEDFHAESKLHIKKILFFIKNNEPIHMILPAFPAKSPNRRKTLGVYPDKGEELAFKALHKLCENIKKIYSPGAKLTICSDGRVFAELVRISDQSVSEYKNDLIQRVGSPYAETIDFFDLDDVFSDISEYDTLREELMINYGESLRSLRQRCKTDKSTGEMYKGICKFLMEDYSGLDEFADSSKNNILGIARANAYRVIQRSNAWTNLLKDRFPNSIRLSIHPQPRVSEKIGIFLIDSDDVWRTPWHSVAIKDGERFSLVPRHVAESDNAFLVFENGKPSYFSRPFGTAI